MSLEVEDFYGVYLLCNMSEKKKFRNRVYIGFTVNPSRRINQHNKGQLHGGAKRTSNKGPWKMVMIVHGFPNNVTALQFEWAWQKWKESGRLKELSHLQKKNETHFDHHFRILAEMLRTQPWSRLPLVVRWLAPEYVKDFSSDKLPPMHMQICHGPVTIKKKPKLELSRQTSSQNRTGTECHLCMKPIENPKRSKITCLNPKCKLVCHVICLADQCLPIGHYVPIEGECPICGTHFLWGNLIRKKNGCNDLEESPADVCVDDEFSSSLLMSSSEE